MSIHRSTHYLLKVNRFQCNPIIHLESGNDIGGNINGPSLIKVPDWLQNPLGRYYLYFAHHKGTYIRLAYSDRLSGPWNIHPAGTLHLKDSYYKNHIASPDVHVDNSNKQIRMYYHGVEIDGSCATGSAPNVQSSKVSLSPDGINFTSLPETLGHPYLRVFKWSNYFYAIGMPGVIYRSKDGLTKFEKGPTLFDKNMRHCAVRLDGSSLQVFYSKAGDCPEQIYVSIIDLIPDWFDWHESEPLVLLKPEMDYEGVNIKTAPSQRGAVMEKVHQLRDPAIFIEGSNNYLIYSVAGEQGLAIGKLI
jgi:hypothetical protein